MEPKRDAGTLTGTELTEEDTLSSIQYKQLNKTQNIPSKYLLCYSQTKHPHLNIQNLLEMITF